jgi:hypothetical protein
MIQHLKENPRYKREWIRGDEKNWEQFYRIRLPKSDHGPQKSSWCRKNCEKFLWGCSEGHEVYYFVRLEDAVSFRLRWEGAES